MQDNLRVSLLLVCRLLEKHKVSYLLIGGTAVALNGYFRHSVDKDGELTEKPDIDIWYNPTYTNYFKILEVIQDLGNDVTEWKKELNTDPKKSVFKLEFDDFTFDILPVLKADMKFSDAKNRSDTIHFEGVPIHFLSYTDLIADKQAMARQKDIQDIEQLKKINYGKTVR